jgi:hypothetical protein
MPRHLPRNNAELAIWLANYGKQLPTHGPVVGLSNAEVGAEQKRCTTLISAIQNADQKRKEWLSATESTQQTKQKELPALLGTLARMKAHGGWTPVMAQSLGVMASAPAAGPLDTYRPTIRAQVQAGRVEIKFTRRPLDGVNVYTRRRGEPGWRLLGRYTQSPCVDATPTPVGAVEVREYRIIGVKRDREVGQASEAAIVTLGE